MIKKTIWAALPILALSVTASAAGPSVVIGYENNGADPYMVTQAQGLFQKDIPGRVSLKFFASGPAAMSALASGSLQFMCGIGIPPLVAGISQGLPLAIVFNQERYMDAAGIVVRPGSGIKTVADLKGKTIAIVAGSQSSFELATFLQQAHVPMGSVRQLNMAPPQMRVAWTTKSIDAAIVWDPVFDALRGMGGQVIKTDADLPPDASSYNVCIADTKWVRAHPKIAVGFVRALDEGVTYTTQHPQAALAIMAKAAGISDAVAKTELAGYKVYGAADQTTPQVLGSGGTVATSDTTKTLENTAKVLMQIGRITEMPKDVSAAVDPSFAADAAR